MLDKDLELSFAYEEQLRNTLIEEEALKRMSPAEREAYLNNKRDAARSFSEAVGNQLDRRGVPKTKTGFDEAYDKIRNQAPSPEAAVLGQRELGRRWSHFRRGFKSR